MVRFIWFNPETLSDEAVVEALRRAPQCFFAGPNSSLGELLSVHGINAVPLPDEGAPDGSVVVISQGALYDLVHISDRLLGPGGCPWDQAQTHETLKQYLLEEAYEVLDAIDSNSDDKLQEELGDLLLQPVIHAQMKHLAGSFDVNDVAQGIVDKLVRRHPHVFGDTQAETSEEVLKNWDAIKKAEKGGASPSVLSGIPSGMASLLRAYQVSKRAVRAGFEWPDIEAVFDKLHEEEAELREALEAGDSAEVESEIGDLLFTAVNLARWAKVEPEEALRKMLNRFTERFMAMEKEATGPLEDLSPGEWDELWERAKASTVT